MPKKVIRRFKMIHNESQGLTPFSHKGAALFFPVNHPVMHYFLSQNMGLARMCCTRCSTRGGVVCGTKSLGGGGRRGTCKSRSRDGPEAGERAGGPGSPRASPRGPRGRRRTRSGTGFKGEHAVRDAGLRWLLVLRRA